MESILDSIKKMLGMEPNYEHFDADLILYINATFNILNQLGVGPKEGFNIKDRTNKWTEYIEDIEKIEMIKTYIYMKVKIMFDPSLTSSVNETMKEIIKELEWRLNVQVDPGGDS